MKKFVYLTLLFIVIITSGYFANENFKKLTARTLGYEGWYNRYWGRCMFGSSSINYAFNKIREKHNSLYTNNESLKIDKEFNRLINLNVRNQAIIELSGKFFTLILSAAGIILWYFRRRKNSNVKMHDYIFLISSLFFLRETILTYFDIRFQSKLCAEASIWKVIGIYWFYPEIYLLNLSIILFALIFIYAVPIKERMVFTLSGFFGSIISSLLIVKYVGYWLG